MHALSPRSRESVHGLAIGFGGCVPADYLGLDDVRVIRVFDAPRIEIIDRARAFSTASARLLRNRSVRGGHSGEHDESVVGLEGRLGR